MASYNTRIVRRSNAIAGYAYGKGLRYGEVMATGSGPVGAVTAGAVTAGLGALLAGFADAGRAPGARPRPAQARRGPLGADPGEGLVPPRRRGHDDDGRALHRARLGARATRATRPPR